MSTNICNESERIAAALVCIAALQQARQQINAMPFSESADEYFRRRDKAVTEIFAISGPVSPMAAGVIGLLVGMVCEGLDNGGYSCNELLDCYDAGTWTPEAALAAHEVVAARQEFTDACRLDDTVIQFPAKLSA